MAGFACLKGCLKQQNTTGVRILTTRMRTPIVLRLCGWSRLGG
jgi:hypothetical protein